MQLAQEAAHAKMARDLSNEVIYEGFTTLFSSSIWGKRT
jgi:hypothetical protein